MADEDCFERLDVGGKKFVTTASTLTKRDIGSALAVMASELQEKRKTQGYEAREMFLDRDGTHFRHILNWLRDGAITPEMETSIYHELLQEAEYYRLPGLVYAIKSILTEKREGNSTQPRTSKVEWIDEFTPPFEKVDNSINLGEAEMSRRDVIELLHGPLRLQGTNLSGLNLSSLNLSGGNFRNTRLINTKFPFTDLENANFESCEATGANFRKARLLNCDFSGGEMVGAVLDGTHSKNAKFDEVRLENASFREANLSCATFDGANLSKTNMSRSRLVGASFRNANLTEANLSHADLHEKHGYWDGGPAILTQARLTRVNFFRANLKNVNVKDSVDYRSAINLSTAIGYTPAG